MHCKIRMVEKFCNYRSCEETDEKVCAYVVFCHTSRSRREGTLAVMQFKFWVGLLLWMQCNLETVDCLKPRLLSIQKNNNKFSIMSSTSIQVDEGVDSISSGANWGPLSVLYKFSRPHTIKGTLLASLMGVTRALIENPTKISLSLIPKAIIGLLALLCGNAYIVGINQIYDVKVDEVRTMCNDGCQKFETHFGTDKQAIFAHCSKIVKQRKSMATGLVVLVHRFSIPASTFSFH